MMPATLINLANQLDIHHKKHSRFRVAFGIACIERVEHLITEPEIASALQTGKAYVAGTCDSEQFQQAVADAKILASSHPGSGMIDGSGNAAVSTSRGVAAALAGRALEAAEYAAYASVYAYASHAVTDKTAYDEEFAWQEKTFRELADEYSLLDTPH